jgi:hypothetical protein
MRVSERLGELVGAWSGPVFKAISHARGARTFHPRGDLVRATFSPSHPHLGKSWFAALGRLGDRLAGEGLLRFSNALWKVPRWPDALGCALAFLDSKGRPEQDLLMATIRRPWTMPFSPFSTKVHDFLANDYFAVSPFSAPGLPWLWLRLHPEAGPERAVLPRRQLLAQEVAAKSTLTLAGSESPWGRWTPFLRVTLQTLLPGDPPGLEFDPFLDERGLVPRGFVHALRHGAYAGSRAGRH